jgi:coproporphyrinogen III oxidase-like Fe-S oxidoreductase
MKRTERIALSLRTREGFSRASVQDRHCVAEEFVAIGLLRQSNGNFVLTQKGKSLADSVAEAFL